MPCSTLNFRWIYFESIIEYYNVLTFVFVFLIIQGIFGCWKVINVDCVALACLSSGVHADMLSSFVRQNCPKYIKEVQDMSESVRPILGK